MGLAPPKHKHEKTAIYRYKAHTNEKVSSCSFHYAEIYGPKKPPKFAENVCCSEVKIDKILGVTYYTFLSNATTFRND